MPELSECTLPQKPQERDGSGDDTADVAIDSVMELDAVHPAAGKFDGVLEHKRVTDVKSHGLIKNPLDRSESGGSVAPDRPADSEKTYARIFRDFGDGGGQIPRSCSGGH